jgi:hypothetical protein
MNAQSPLHTKSTKFKQALSWMSEQLRDQPAKKRHEIVQEAELRFDLTPIECDFLDKHFGGQAGEL